MTDFRKAAEHVLDVEGGYQNHPDDKGNYLCADLKWPKGSAPNCTCNDGSEPKNIGTNRGISATVLANHRGRFITVDEMKGLTKQIALDIYKVEFWDRIKGDYIHSQEVATLFFDAAVIMHPRQATKLMQRVLNTFGHDLAVDGACGMLTINAINSTHPGQLHNAFRDKVLEFLDDTDDKGNNASFANGWQNRFEAYPNLDETNEPDAPPLTSMAFTSAGVALEEVAISVADHVPRRFRSIFHKNKLLVKVGIVGSVGLGLAFLFHAVFAEREVIA